MAERRLKLCVLRCQLSSLCAPGSTPGPPSTQPANRRLPDIQHMHNLLFPSLCAQIRCLEAGRQRCVLANKSFHLLSRWAPGASYGRALVDRTILSFGECHYLHHVTTHSKGHAQIPFHGCGRSPGRKVARSRSDTLERKHVRSLPKAHARTQNDSYIVKIK